MEMLEIARRRYTTKHYDRTKRLSEKDFNALLEVLRLSPSSVNSQPWHWFVADNDEACAKIMPAIMGFNRPRVENASHFIIFAIRNEIDSKYLDELLAQEVADGRVSPADAERGCDAGRRALVDMHATPEDKIAWEMRQLYISLGMLLFAAAGMGIDATTIEGMDFDMTDDILRLREQGWQSVVAVALGYRSADDSNATRPKSRWPIEKVVTKI